MSHFDKLVKLPSGFVVVASTANSEFAAIAHESKPIYGASSNEHGQLLRSVTDMMKSESHQASNSILNSST